MSVTLLNRLLAEGLTPNLRETINAMVSGERSYVDRARSEWHRDGEIEIDPNAIVSESEEGAYVQAWVWVSKPETEDT